jgi:hypothetical protein
MKYVNPFLFLPDLAEDGDVLVDRRALAVQKKKLLAEIELSDRKTVEINGAELNKNDILNLFDKLANTTDLQFHQAIANDEALSHFLAEGYFDSKEQFADNELYDDPLFIHFISPYYEEVFTNAVLKSFYDEDVLTMQMLWANPMLMDGDHRENSYRRINRYLYEQKNKLLLLKEQSIADKKATSWEFERYYSIQLIALLNQLPFEFQQFVDDYALELINTGVGIQHINLKLAVQMLESVRQLQCDEFIQEQNEERYQIMYNNLHHRVKTSSRGGYNWWHIVWVVFILFRIIFSVSKCNERSPNLNSFSTIETISRHNDLVQTLSFTSSEKYTAIEVFTNKLSDFAGDKDNFKKAYTPKEQVVTGTNVYGDVFVKLGINKQQRKIDTSAYGKVLMLSEMEKNPRVSAWMYQQELNFENKSDYDVIAIIQTQDSAYSSYVKANEAAHVLIRNGINRVFFYFGKNFDPTTAIGNIFNEKQSSSKQKGAFRTVSPVTVKYLQEPFFVMVNPENISTQDKKSWFTIETKEGLPEINCESLSSLSVEMKRRLD